MSKITVVGNVTGEPELRFTPSGAAVTNFTVAENRRKFNKNTNEWEDNGTTFYRCAIWREAAENTAESIERGARVIVVGEFYSDEYEKKDGGGKGISLNINVDEIGPSTKYATMKVTKTQRSNGNGGGGGNAPSNDQWASAPAASDEPPF